MSRPKKCKVCKEVFEPRSTLQTVCGLLCAIKLSEKQKVKNERLVYKLQKEKLKSRSDWLKDAQSIFNSYIRKRDDSLACISCGRHHHGQYHAGHYRTVGANPELRFEVLNVHKQCSVCNNHLHGNLINYRINLINKIGYEKVEWLESKHEPKKYTVEEIKEIILKYKKLTKELKSSIQQTNKQVKRITC